MGVARSKIVRVAHPLVTSGWHFLLSEVRVVDSQASNNGFARGPHGNDRDGSKANGSPRAAIGALKSPCGTRRSHHRPIHGMEFEVSGGSAAVSYHAKREHSLGFSPERRLPACGDAHAGYANLRVFSIRKRSRRHAVSSTGRADRRDTGEEYSHDQRRTGGENRTPQCVSRAQDRGEFLRRGRRETRKSSRDVGLVSSAAGIAAKSSVCRKTASE